MNKLSRCSIELELDNIKMMALWHKIFDYAPGLLVLSSNGDGKDILESFLRWAEIKNMSMNWATHIHLLNWLVRQEKWKHSMNMSLIKESLVAAAIRWSLDGFGHINVKGMMIASSLLKNSAAVLCKNTKLSTKNFIFIAKLKEKSYPLQDSYALLKEINLTDEILWENIPG